MNYKKNTFKSRIDSNIRFARTALLIAAASCMTGAAYAQPATAPDGYREESFGRVMLFGLDPAWASGREFESAVDGDPRTYYDYKYDDREGYLGADLGRRMVPTMIIFHPRIRYEERMVGGRFEGSNESPWSGYEVIHEILDEPEPREHRIEVRTDKAYRYFRYVGPAGSHGNIAEFNMYLDPWEEPDSQSGETGSGTEPVPTQYRETSLYGLPFFGIDPARTPGREFEMAVDGNPATYYDTLNPDGGFLGVDLGRELVAKTVMFTPRRGHTQRMVGGRFEGSNVSPTEGYVTLYEITSPPSEGAHEIDISVAEPYRYYRYVGPTGSHCNIAEFNMSFRNDQPSSGQGSGVGGGNNPDLPDGYREATSGSSVVFGLDPAWASGREFEKALDGNPATYYDYAYSDRQTFIGIDGGEALLPERVRFTPRQGYEARMIGGRFEGSNESPVSGYETLYTITSKPPAAEQVVNLNANKAYRYFRYVAPAGSHGNIAELKFETRSLRPLVIVPNARSFLAVDLGAAARPASFEFTKRADGGGGITGGELQGSNEGPNSGFFTIRRFSSEPADGGNVVPLNTVNAYRYYRFLGAEGDTASIADFTINP